MFVRFVTRCRDEESHHFEGVFQAAFRLRNRGRLAEATRFEALRQWFNVHLPVPARFSLSRGRRAGRRAVCWFRADAVEHLGKVRELAALLERHGAPTRRLRAPRPGYVVYEDAFQVAAVPFRDVVA